MHQKDVRKMLTHLKSACAVKQNQQQLIKDQDHSQIRVQSDHIKDNKGNTVKINKFASQQQQSFKMSGWGELTKEDQHLNDIDKVRIDMNQIVTEIYSIQREALKIQQESKDKQEKLQNEIDAKDKQLGNKQLEIDALKKELNEFARKWEELKAFFSQSRTTNNQDNEVIIVDDPKSEQGDEEEFQEEYQDSPYNI